VLLEGFRFVSTLAPLGRSKLIRPALLLVGLLLVILPAASGAQTPPRMVDSYPRPDQTHVPVDAELYFVFDQPTSKAGTFSVADVDSNSPGTLLLLEAPRWSELGDTVYLKPVFPMEFGHLHGMRVNTIFGAAPDSLVASDLPIVYFKTFPRSQLERQPSPNEVQSITLVPELPTPVETPVREVAGNAVTFTQALIELWADPTAVIASPDLGTVLHAPAYSITVPVFFRVPRRSAALLSVPVTVPRDLARAAPDGELGLRIVYQGTDETGLPLSFEALSNRVTTVFADTILALTPVLLTPELAGNATIRSAVLEWPLPGAAIAAGDTLRPRAVVIGTGTGPFRAAFYLDGEVVAIEEGFMESGRPVTVEMRGPLPTRRLGERRLQFVVESPQNVAAQPITFLTVPPVHGLTPPGSGNLTEAPPDTGFNRLRVESTWLADARSRFRSEESSATGWAAWKARLALSATRSLEARVTSRIRVDDVENGSASPEQLLVRYAQPNASVEWGDLAPAIANGAPLFASPVPRRSAQAVFSAAGLGTLEAYAALESRPRSSGGFLRELRSDLYAARLSRSFARNRVRASLYGGYTHEDPTPGGFETATRSRVIYGGSAGVSFLDYWLLTADAASVRHRTIPGVESGRTRTGIRAELIGTAARIDARAEAFRYQPGLQTALNPYAISDRRGFAVDLARPILSWRAFGGYRRERPEDEASGAPSVTAERISLGARFSLNQDSWVTPALVRIRQTGDQTDFTQMRIATEFTASEQLGGRTTARFDAGTYQDEKGLNTRRRVLAGSIVSVRRLPGRITSTTIAGVERDENRDFDKRDMTIQGSMEVRVEVLPSRLLVAPFVSYTSRDYELRGFKEDRLGGRLQVSLLRLPGLGDAALSVQGRVERIWFREPLGTRDTEGAVEVSLGKRLSILR
jgi:hypothetical protein